MTTISTIDFVVMGVYLILLLILGYAIRKMTSNVSDYFRGGCKGTWWLVGMSIFISSISARTFTANAGVGYTDGWTVNAIYLANIVAALVMVLLAGRFRRIRATTMPEVVRLRYGVGLEQFYAYWGVIFGNIGGATMLWALAIFCSAVFQIDLTTTIIVLGVVVIFYSCSGGRWAVMATDFLQGLIIMPITFLIAILALIQLGGIGGMFGEIHAQGLTEQFKMVKEYDMSTLGNYSLQWIMAVVVSQIIFSMTLGSAVRFFSVKDEREGRKAAWLNVGLCVIGAAIWIVPAIAARLLFPEVVDGMDIGKPAEAAYAVVSMQLLPLGLLGIMVIAMFSTTASTLDTGLNGAAGIVVINMYPAICRRFKFKQVTDEVRLIRYSRWITVIFGIIMIMIALYFSGLDGAGMFEIMLDLTALLGIPTVIPNLMGLYIKRTPAWSGIFSICVALIPSFVAFCGNKGWFGVEPWAYHEKVFIILFTGIAAYLFTMLFWKHESEEKKAMISEFFARVRRPIDFAGEVGSGTDALQMRFLGLFCMIIGGGVLLLLTIANSLIGVFSVLFLALSMGGIGFALWFGGRRMDQGRG